MEWTKTIFNADSGNSSQMAAAQQKEKNAFLFSTDKKKTFLQSILYF